MRAKVGLLTIGRVSDAERSEVARHLNDCPSCRSEREDIARVVDLLDVLRSTPDNSPQEMPTSPAAAAVPLLLRPPAQLCGAPGTPHRPLPATVPNRTTPHPISPPAHPATDQTWFAPHPAGAAPHPAVLPPNRAADPPRPPSYPVAVPALRGPARLVSDPAAVPPRRAPAPAVPIQRRAVPAGPAERPAPAAVPPQWPVAVPPQQTAFLAGAVGRPAPRPIESARPEPGRPAPPFSPFSPAEPYPPVITPVVLRRPSRPAPRREGYLPPRPATGPLSIGPHSHRRPRRRSPSIAVSSVILTVTLAAGAVLYPWPEVDTQDPVVATAASGATTEVTLRAVLRGEADGLGVELTVGGLTPGVSYQVYAATVDDDLNLLGEFTGAAGPVRWSGTAQVPVDDLAYLSVGEAGGRVLAAATVVRGSQAPL